MKYAKYIIGWFIAGLVLSYGLSVAASTIFGFQGGTGYSTTTASNVGNFLQVASTSPYLTYTFGTSTGGTGTLSGNGTSTQVAFYTALQTLSSSLNLFWDNVNSRLGIGTSTPSVALHVVGDTLSTGSSTAEHFILGGFSPDSIYPATDPNSSISWTGPDVMQLTTGGVARVTINAIGNVGVGTTTPATTLDINGNVSERGYNDFYAISNPVAPAAGISRTHALTTQGVTRVEVDNECSMNNTINRDNYFVAKNVSGSTMATGTPAYRSGNTGAVPNVDRASASATTTLPAIGVSEGTVANNAFGCFMNYGILSPVDTSALSAGDTFVAVASGTLTNARPTVPNSVQRIGSVLSAGVGNGSLLITIAPAVQGMETGTIQTAFNINGANALTTSTGQLAISFPIPVASTSLAVSATSALALNVNTLYNNGVTSTVAGTGIGISLNGGTATITNNGVQSLSGSSTIGVSSATGTPVLGAKFYPIPALFYYATSTTIWDDVISIFRATSTINDASCVNKNPSDTVTINFYYGASANTATSSAFKLFTSDQTITSTSTPTILTINASSTPSNNNPLRLVASAASSTLSCTLHYTEQ